jgi:hypothetical protein
MGMSDAEVFDAMSGALQERGLATAEQVAADRAVQPFNTSTETAVKTVDTTNLEATQVDPMLEQINREAFEAPATPAGYRFDPVPQGVTYDPQQDIAMRGVFHDAGVPQAIAAQVDRMYAKAILNPPTASQLEQATQATHLQLTRTYGDEARTVVEVAQREFRAMAAKQPQLVEMVERSGMGSDFYVISSLYNIAKARGRA